MDKNYADLTVGISEAVRNFRKTIDAAGDKPVGLLQNNKIIAYLVPVKTYGETQEELLELRKEVGNKA
jgi:PHD/YefM family antitoxin component YafN of YafNO toxin-antitoxin module